MASLTGKINPRSIAALRPGDLLRDTELRRFGARRRREDGFTTYFIRARIDGRQRWITLGRDGPLTPAQARDMAKRMLAEVDSGRDPTRERETRRGMPTVAKFADEWLAKHVDLKRKSVTAREYRRLVHKHILPAVGHVPVDRIDRTDAINLHTGLVSHRYAANRVLAVFSSLMTYAEQRELRPPASKPCRGLERFDEAKRKRFLSVRERARLWTYLDEIEPIEGPYVVAAFRILLLTGMRKQEVLGLRHIDVDLAERIVYLRDAKTGPREVMLSTVAVNILKRLPRQVGNPFVFCGHKAGHHIVNLFKPWMRIRTRLGFADVRVHDLRHTVGSVLARKNQLPVVRDVLGHQVLETTSGYSHTANDDVRDAVEDLALEIAGGI
jgi:integrase